MSSLIAEGLNTAMVGLIMVFACLLLLMLVIVGIGKLSSLADRAGQDSRRTDEDYNGFDNVKEEVAVLCAVLSSMDVADTAKVSVSHRESGV